MEESIQTTLNPNTPAPAKVAEDCPLGNWKGELSVAVEHWSNRWFKMTL